MPAHAIQQAGGRVHGVQLWVNLPRAEKMIAPRYQGITADEIPVAESGGATVRLIAGSFDGQSGAVETNSPVAYFHVTVPAGASVRLPVAEGQNAFAYLIGGSARFGSEAKPADVHDLVLFERAGDSVELSGPTDGEPGEVLFLAGQPLGEPVARYGPFVMNTRDEIIQAVEDYQSGRMGQISH
jgi:redox-sensitive bicupin YhaK (pirin superfamily)